MSTETRYHPDPEQLELGSSIDKSLAALLPLSRLHASFHESASTWSSLAQIGVFAIATSVERDGSGLGAVEEAQVVIGLGRRLVSPGVLAAIGAAHLALDRKAQVTAEIRTAAAFRSGNRSIMVHEPGAARVLLRDDAGAALYDAGTVISRTVDERLWLAALGEVANVGELVGRFDQTQLSRLRLIDAAALAGMAEAVLDMSVAYAGAREQFGRPIGSFQAVKHHCANMAMAARCARDQTSFASVALDEGRADASLQVECAFFVSASAALENAGKNIQIHGGIGFSDEADPHRFLKRAQLQIAIAGGLEAANRRIASAKADC